MKVLLIGADEAVREERRALLASEGYEAIAIAPDEAEPYIADAEIVCMVLGSTLREKIAQLLASEFTAAIENRFVVRVVEEPAAPKYPYAHFVVTPRNPAALLAAVKAVAIRLKQPSL